MNDGGPVWIRIVFGLAAALMGAVILGALAGVVPTDGGGFTAPAAVILALGAGLILFAIMLWIPRSTPGAVKTILGGLLLLLVAGVCNWSAFAPGVRYTSETTIGGWTRSGEDTVGGRIAFGLVALVIDAVLAYGIFEAIRRALRRG
jgi:riboflavin transporter FmnP